MAPTPSGYLHAGNALNFVLTWLSARTLSAKLLLRIDDHDQTRVRDSYLENIFQTLDWLGLDWDEGPTGPSEQKGIFSQARKKDYYFEELQKFSSLFGCECSRSELKKIGKVYPGLCLTKGLTFKKNETCLRVKTETSWEIPEALNYSILWRKDDLPAYQWVSVIEDRDQRITHLVRGKDLEGSTLFQSALSKVCGFSFPENCYHHELILLRGEKLSKSQKAPSLFNQFKSSEDFYLEVISPFFGLKRGVQNSTELLGQDLCLFK